MVKTIGKIDPHRIIFMEDLEGKQIGAGEAMLDQKGFNLELIFTNLKVGTYYLGYRYADDDKSERLGQKKFIVMNEGETSIVERFNTENLMDYLSKRGLVVELVSEEVVLGTSVIVGSLKEEEDIYGRDREGK